MRSAPRPRPHNVSRVSFSRRSLGETTKRTDDRAAAGARRQAGLGASAWRCAGTIRAGSGAKTRRSGPAATKAPGSAGSISSTASCATLAPLQDFGQRAARAEIHRRAAPRHGRIEPRPRGAGQELGIGARLSRRCMCSIPPIPDQVRRFESGIDVARTLFIVASKSGTTLEPNVLMDYFFARGFRRRRRARPDGHFVAITDPGSRLQKTAQRTKAFAASSSAFPASAAAIPCCPNSAWCRWRRAVMTSRAFLRTAARDGAGVRCRRQPRPKIPASRSASSIGVLALHGRDKLTIIASPLDRRRSAPGSSNWWPSSTGKNGRGIIPIADEPLGDSFGLRRRSAVRLSARRRRIRIPHRTRPSMRWNDAGHPLVRIAVASPQRLAQEFFRFEMATAVAGAILGINPFDQPDVEASKIATRAMTEAFEKTGALPAEPPVFEEHGVALYTDAGNADSAAEAWRGPPRLKAGSRRTSPGSLPAITSRSLAYLDATRRALQALQKSARGHPRPNAARDLPAIRPALSAFDRAGLQRRAEQRRVSSDHGAACCRSGGSGPRCELRRDRGGASRGRFPCAGRARPARVARAYRGRTSMRASPPSPKR